MQVKAKPGAGIHVLNYNDELAIKVVLIKGNAELKGKFKGNAINALFKTPGDQVQIDRITGELRKTICDVDNITSWDNAGYFRFVDAGLPAIFRALNRWYDMPLISVGAIPGYTMEGSLPYNAPIESVFRLLEANGPIRFHIKDDSIFVTSRND